MEVRRVRAGDGGGCGGGCGGEACEGGDGGEVCEGWFVVVAGPT